MKSKSKNDKYFNFKEQNINSVVIKTVSDYFKIF